MENIKEKLNFEKFSKNVAILSDGGEIVTYGDIDFFAKEIRNYIFDRSLIFCLCTNTIGSILGYVSFLKNGIIPVLLDSTKDKDITRFLIECYNPNYLWLPNEQANTYAGSTIFSKYGYSLLDVSERKNEIFDELALLLTTSGSTGSPKLVRLSYENIFSNAESIIDYLKISQDERPILLLPMFYSFGLSIINTHLLKGATILITNKSITQKEFWKFVKEQGATSLSSVPYTYDILKRLNFPFLNLPKMKTLTQAGGKMNYEMVKEYIRLCKHNDKCFYVMYGQTEATARMSYLPISDSEEKYKSVGIPIPGGEFKLIDENGSYILNAEEEGELVYIGKNVSLGYANNYNDLSKGNENNKHLYTGDIAKRDMDGYFYISGRKSRFLKILGNRINLDYLEQLLKEITFSCVCVGVDDKLTVFVTEIEKKTEINAFLTKKIGLASISFNVIEIENIPLNTSGKVLYSELMKKII